MSLERGLEGQLGSLSWEAKLFRGDPEVCKRRNISLWRAF